MEHADFKVTWIQSFSTSRFVTTVWTVPVTFWSHLGHGAVRVQKSDLPRDSAKSSFLNTMTLTRTAVIYIFLGLNVCVSCYLLMSDLIIFLYT